MRKLLLVVFLVISIKLSFAQSFTGKVTYEATIIGNGDPNYDDYNVVMPIGFKDLEIKSGIDAVPINFNLVFNDKESLYKIEYDMAEIQSLGLFMNQTNLVGRQSYVYYTNLETNEKVFQNYWTKHVLVKMDTVNWKLTQENKKIGDYIAYKATAIIDSEQTHGKNFLSPVVAWYTPEIAIPFGVQNFIGLPGLTLELITEVVLNSEEEIQIKKPSAKQTISERDYVSLIKDLNDRRKN